MKQFSILIVDDSRDLLELMRRQLSDQGLTPYVSDNVMDAIEIIENSNIDLIITDINMPDVNGEQLIRFVSERFQHIPIIVITGYPDLSSAVHVMKLGAIEYLIKPFTERELLNAIEKIMLSYNEQIPAITNSGEKLKNYHGIIGESEAMLQLFQTIDRVKSNKATVLITGESGTGKELVARAIHYNSDFASAPFVPVNCGAIPDQLLESELFGHLKGSFTGAITNRDGFFQAANGGTLFLDEISNTSLEVQAKLLRAIQEKEVTPIGSTKSEKIDLRVVTATNVNLQDLIDQKKFREDLFYRLNIISIEIPPLRKRGGDIIKLISYFNQKFSKELNKKPVTFSKGSSNILTAYSWPGNVRELENFIQRTVIMHDGEININEIPEYMKSTPEPGVDVPWKSLAEMEREYILKVVNYTKNNKSEAARILKIDRKTLREKLK